MTAVVDLEPDKGIKFVLWKGRKSKPLLISRVLRALAMNLRVGVSEAQALNLIGTQYSKYEIGKAFEKASKLMLESGYTLQEALLAQEVIPRTARQLIAAARTSQALHDNIEEASRIVSEASSVKKKLLGELIQPGFMAVLCLVFLFLSVAVIIPGFIGTFSSLGAETPALTLLMLDFADIATWVVGGFIVLLLLSFLYWFTLGRRSSRARRIVSAVGLKMPFIGSIIQLTSTARLFQLLTANLSTGIAEPEALAGAANGCGNEAIKQHCVNHAERMLKEGVPMREFAQTWLFPVEARHVLATAPSRIQEMQAMTHMAPEYDREAQIQLDQLSKTLGPVSNNTMQVLAGLLVVTLLLPMFSIYPAIMNLA